MFLNQVVMRELVTAEETEVLSVDCEASIRLEVLGSNMILLVDLSGLVQRELFV